MGHIHASDVVAVKYELSSTLADLYTKIDDKTIYSIIHYDQLGKLKIRLTSVKAWSVLWDAVEFGG
jgi:hypothetical protein